LAKIIVNNVFEYHLKIWQENGLAAEAKMLQEFTDDLIAAATKEETRAFLELD